jgi:hypothetical protein
LSKLWKDFVGITLFFYYTKGIYDPRWFGNLVQTMFTIRSSDKSGDSSKPRGQ